MKKFLVLSLLALSAVVPIAARAHGDACPKPFQATGNIAMPLNYSGVVAQFPVPAGYRLQVEQVSARMRLSLNTDRAYFQLATTTGGVFAYHELEVAQGYSTIDWKTFGPVTLYADKGTDVRVYFTRTGTTYPATTGFWTVSGCLFAA